MYSKHNLLASLCFTLLLTSCSDDPYFDFNPTVDEVANVPQTPSGNGCYHANTPPAVFVQELYMFEYIEGQENFNRLDYPRECQGFDLAWTYSNLNLDPTDDGKLPFGTPPPKIVVWDTGSYFDDSLVSSDDVIWPEEGFEPCSDIKSRHSVPDGLEIPNQTVISSSFLAELKQLPPVNGGLQYDRVLPFTVDRIFGDDWCF